MLGRGWYDFECRDGKGHLNHGGMASAIGWDRDAAAWYVVAVGVVIVCVVGSVDCGRDEENKRKMEQGGRSGIA